MKRRARWGTVLALLLVANSCRRAADPVATTEAGVTPAETNAVDTLQLYFPSSDGKLHGELHKVARLDQPEQRVARLVETLAAGPISTELWSPLPDLLPPSPADPAAEGTGGTGGTEGTATPQPPRVRAYLVEDTVYVDLAPAVGPPSVGVRQELLMLYSLVNSVLLNTPEASRLVVLWNGQQPETFAGHIDTARPLAPRPSLIAKPAT